MTLYLDSGGAATNSGCTDTPGPLVSGTANATCVSSKTFVDANVNVALNTITITTHGYSSGFAGVMTTTATLPAGINTFQMYFIFAVDANTITLHTNATDAATGANAIDITAAAGGGTHTFNNCTVQLGGAPSLTGVFGNLVNLTTTGLSHIWSMAGAGPHGLTTGDRIFWNQSNGSSTIGNTALNSGIYYVNALSTTTFRYYTTRPLAIAGGASDLNVATGGNRSTYFRSQSQSNIALASSTTANAVNFWIMATDDTNKWVIVDRNVLGLGAGSNWAIGGQVSQGGLINFCNTLRNGDMVCQNTDLTFFTSLTIRNFAASLLSPQTVTNMPPLVWYGKTGARRLLSTNNGSGMWNYASSPNVWYYNLEMQATGATGGISNNTNGVSSVICSNVRFTDWGNSTIAWTTFGGGLRFYACDATGPTGAGTGFSSGNNACEIYNCYIHDLATFGLSFGTAGGPYIIGNCLIDRIGTVFNWSNGIATESIVRAYIFGNTFYRGSGNGIVLANQASLNFQILYVANNIIKDMGDVATESNFTIYGGLTVQDWMPLFSDYNIYNNSGGLGGSNVINFTLSPTDLTLDPQFVDPDNATPTSRNFTPGNASAVTPMTWPPNTATTSYRVPGAVQPVNGGGGGGGGQSIIGGGL